MSSVLQNPRPEPRIYVLDNDTGRRAALADDLAGLGLPVSGHGTAAGFLAVLRPGEAGCVLLGGRLPGTDAAEILAALRAAGSDLAAVVLVGEGDIPAAVRALRAGAADVLPRSVAPEALRESVRAAVAASEAAAARTAVRRDAAERLGRLTPRQAEVLRLALEGLPNKVIARRLEISLRGVERHRADAFRALGVETTIEAATLVRLAGTDER